nr:hypothetical protein [bacterium]
TRNQPESSRRAGGATADGLARVRAPPSPDPVLSDLDTRQAFYGNNRVLFRTQPPPPGGLFLGETRQQFFSGKMLNGEARDNCTSLALYRYLFWRSWLVAEFNLDRHYNGVWQSPLSTLQRETHQQFSLKLPGVADSWRWRPAFRYRRDHLYQESPYNQGLESWSWFGSLLLEKSFSPDDRLQMLTELDATAIEGESYRLNRRLGRGRLQVALAPLERLRLQSGLELLYEDERDRWLRSGWLQGALKLSAQLEWRIELASRQDFLPFSWQRGGAEVLQQYREAYPLLRADAVTDFLPDPAAISCSRRGGSTTVSYRHTAGHSVALTGWSWAFRDFPYLYATVDSAATVGQQPTTLYGEELRLDLQLPRQLHWLTLQSWQRDSKGVVNPELPTLRFASELRWDGHFYEGALHFNLACGATSTWGAIRTDGEPLSDQVIPYLHLVARQGNFTLYWSFQNPLSFEHYSMEGIPGMHRDEIIGIMWRLVN